MHERGVFQDPRTGLYAIVQPPETESQDRANRRWGQSQATQSLSTTFRHSGWLRTRRLVFEALCRTEQPTSRIDEFSQCGSHAYVLRSLDNPAVHRIAGSSCHDRFCLPCARERSQAIALNCIDQIATKTIRFLTLTVRSTDEPLSHLLDKLYTSFQLLRRRKLWQRKVTGGVAFLEVKWMPKTNRWHPHFHCLIEGTYLPLQKLKSLWYQITKDSYILDIKLVRDLRNAAAYVTKYASKPFNNSFVARPNQLDEALLALKGRKLCLTFGTWRGVLLARTIAEGAWETVGKLEHIIQRAASGDIESRQIMHSLTDLDLADLYARAPPPESLSIEPQPTHEQLTWFAVWQTGGTSIDPTATECRTACNKPFLTRD